MTATTEPGGGRLYSDEDGSTVDLRVPDHVVAWLHGRVDSVQERLIEDEPAQSAEFSLPAWVTGIRGRYPEALVAATYPPHLMGRDEEVRSRSSAEWLDLTQAAAGVDHGGDERSFTGDTTPTSLSSLRRWAVGRLDGHPVRVDDIVLSLSELTTNVERHGGDWLTVDLVERERDLVLAVTDPATDRLPAPREAQPDEPSGRGLLVVASLSMRWGVIVGPSHKTVWAAFPYLR
jgi:anti-sigma regulatory factor (Ser/Thr protein kinase)